MEEHRIIPAAETCAVELADCRREIAKAVKGKDDVIELALLAILARGHILLEDIPGVGKTTLALALSRVMRLSCHRVQFTPDVTPSDVTGYTIYRKQTDSFEFMPGAAMCNLLLADEINRASSKTQSALLEVMEEGAVTVDTLRHETPKPFTVIATQNPTGCAGTQLLPESQLDRFLVRLTMGYPGREAEINILRSKTVQNPLDSIRPLLSDRRLREFQNAADAVHVDDSLYEYMVELAAHTRQHELIELGVSPRGTIALLRLSRAKALLSGRDYLLPSDVEAVYLPALTHRLLLRSRSRAAGKSAEDLLREIFHSVPAPKLVP